MCAVAPEDGGSKNVAASATGHLRVGKTPTAIAKSHEIFSVKLLLLLNHEDCGEGLLLHGFLLRNRHNKVDERGRLLDLAAGYIGG